MRNYLALLGWGDADDETILTTAQLVERFTLERVARNPARFDEQKLRWLNGRHLRELPLDELTRRLEAFTGRERAGPVVAITREKIADARRLLAARGAARSTVRSTTRPRARSGWGRRAARWSPQRARTLADGASRSAADAILAALDDVVAACAVPSAATSSRRCASR